MTAKVVDADLAGKPTFRMQRDVPTRVIVQFAKERMRLSSPISGLAKVLPPDSILRNFRDFNPAAGRLLPSREIFESRLPVSLSHIFTYTYSDDRRARSFSLNRIEWAFFPRQQEEIRAAWRIAWSTSSSRGQMA